MHYTLHTIRPRCNGNLPIRKESLHSNANLAWQVVVVVAAERELCSEDKKRRQYSQMCDRNTSYSQRQGHVYAKARLSVVEFHAGEMVLARIVIETTLALSHFVSILWLVALSRHYIHSGDGWCSSSTCTPWSTNQRWRYSVAGIVLWIFPCGNIVQTWFCDHGCESKSL